MLLLDRLGLMELGGKLLVDTRAEGLLGELTASLQVAPEKPLVVTVVSPFALMMIAMILLTGHLC
jgi:hypothetical protein